jgi:uncharacterized protein (DUF362 family)
MGEVIYKSINLANWEKTFGECLSEGYQKGWFSGLRRDMVIKPNLCNIVSHRAGATTDVRLVELLIDFVRSSKEDVQISIVESDNFERGAEEAFERLGYRQLAREKNVQLRNLTEEKAYSVTVHGVPYTMRIPTVFFTDCFFVSIALPKTHAYQKITAIYKNQFGCIPDAIKERYHEYLEEVLYALNNRLTIPDLSIVDGRIGMEGLGPVAGDPVTSRFILMSNDATAADIACAKLMGFDPRRIPYLKFACRKTGLAVEDVKLPSTANERRFRFIPKWQYRVIRGKIFVTRATIAVEGRGKRAVHIFFRLPSYLIERKVLPAVRFFQTKW